MRTIRMLAMALAVPLLGACATSGRTTGSQDLTTVVVENNLSPPTQVTVYAVSTLGDRTRVGVVPPGATRPLRFPSGIGSGQVSLVALGDGGRQVASQPIPLRGGERVTWSLFANNLSGP